MKEVCWETVVTNGHILDFLVVFNLLWLGHCKSSTDLSVLDRYMDQMYRDQISN